MSLIIRNLAVVVLMTLSVVVFAQDHQDKEKDNKDQKQQKKEIRHFSLGFHVGNRFNSLNDLNTHISRTFSKEARENKLPVERDRHYLASLNFKPFKRWEFQGLMLLNGQKSQLDDLTVKPKLYVFSASPIYRLKLFRFISLNAGVGIAYYLNQLKLESSDESFGDEGEVKFSKGKLGVHWLAGAEIFVTRRLSFDANVTYRYTGLPRWEKNDGVKVTMGDESLEAADLNFHIKGANLNIGLKYYLF